MLRRSIFPLLAALLLGGGGAGCHRGGAGAGSDALAATPELAWQHLGERPRALFCNATARHWLQEQQPALLAAAAPAAEARSGEQAAQDPRLFRQLDRQHRYDLLVLTGSPSEYRPLLDHLLEAKDWKLTYLDHTTLLFRRGGPGWSPAALEPVQQALAPLPAPVRARCTAQAAGKLVAVRELATAREWLATAEKTDAEVPEVWSTWAEWRMAQGDWTGALAACDRALKIDGECAPALGAKAQALYATKHFLEAFRYSSRLLAKRPDDPGLLFYHAKISHEAAHYSEEIRTMKKLIALAEASGRVDPGYYVYLGQAYAKIGEAEPALEQLRRALMDGDLPPEQRKFAEETLLLIQQKTGKRSQPNP